MNDPELPPSTRDARLNRDDLVIVRDILARSRAGYSNSAAAKTDMLRLRSILAYSGLWAIEIRETNPTCVSRIKLAVMADMTYMQETFTADWDGPKDPITLTNHIMGELSSERVFMFLGLLQWYPAERSEIGAKTIWSVATGAVSAWLVERDEAQSRPPPPPPPPKRELTALQKALAEKECERGIAQMEIEIAKERQAIKEALDAKHLAKYGKPRKKKWYDPI